MELFKKINRQKNNTKFRKKTFIEDEAEITAASISTDQVQEVQASRIQNPGPDTLEAPQITPLEEKSPKLSSPKKSINQPGSALVLETILIQIFQDDDTKVPAFKIKKSSASKKLAKYKLKELEVEPLELHSRPVQESYVSYDEDTLSILRKQQDSVNSQIDKKMSALNSGNDFWIDETGNNETVIPDATHIFLAKKKREKIRQGVFDQDEEDPFLSKDYVSLATKGDSNTDLGSRLVREEDEIGDGEEELNLHMGERMSLKKGDMKEQLKKQAQDEMQKALEEFDNLGDSDEEFAALERNRLRQAIGGSKYSTAFDRSSALPMPKAIPLPTFPSIRLSIQNEINLYKERTLPYQATIQSKSAIVKSLDIQLKEMSLQYEALESRILKYANLQKQLSQLK